MNINDFWKKLKQYLFIKSVYAGFYDRWDDERFLKMMYKKSLGRELNLENPQRYTEKQQWVKLHDRNPLYTALVDKCEAKKFVAENLGEEYVIKMLGVWDSADDIDFDRLPDKFVLKCTHDSGGIVICKDKKTLDRKATVKFLNKRLNFNYYFTNREWPYKNVKPRVIAEEYLENELGGEMNDIKLFVYSGIVDGIQYDFNRNAADHADYNYSYFSRNWEPLNYILNEADAKDIDIPKPENLDTLISLAETASLKMGTPAFVRVDMYLNKGRIYFGEFTFFDNAGFGNLVEEWDLYYGSLMKLKKYP